MEVIRLENVWKVYKEGVETVALRGINLSVEEGEYVSIMGPSGSGKSTLMHIMGLLDTPTKGRVYIEGKDVSRMKEDERAKIRRRKIGFVFQAYNLIPSLTAMENVELPLLLDGVPKERRRRIAISLLERMGLGNRLEYYPNQLSGGQQQRVAIARALANDPKIILADEPTGNLDTKTGRKILDLFKELHEEGRTLVVVTHDPEVAKEAERIVKIRDGKVGRMKRLGLLLLLLPIVYGLGVSFQTYPSFPSPGDNVRVTVLLTGYAQNVELKVLDNRFALGDWKDLGDVAGSAAPIIYITVPSDLKPGTYQIPVELRFDEGNASYDEYFSIPLSVVPRTGDLDVSLSGNLWPGVKKEVQVVVENKGEPIRNAQITLVPSLEGSKTVGEINGEITVPFEVIPACKNGVEEFNVVITGYRSGPFEFHKTIMKVCGALTPLEVESNLPAVLTPGEKVVYVRVSNETDLPQTIVVKLSSNVNIGGSTTTTVSLDGRMSKTIPVTLKVPDDAEKVILSVSVLGSDFNGYYTFSSVVKSPPDIMVFLKDVKTGKATLEVANIGEEEAKNVVVYVNGRAHFVGSLTGGDYDTIEFVPETNTLDVKVTYTYLGKEYQRSERIPVELPKQNGSSLWLWIGLIALLAVIAYLWKRGRRE